MTKVHYLPIDQDKISKANRLEQKHNQFAADLR